MPRLTHVRWLTDSRHESWQQGHAYVVQLWAPWCLPCIAEFPELSKLEDTLGDKNVHVLGVAVMPTGGTRTPEAFLAGRKEDVRYAIAEDVEGRTRAELMKAARADNLPMHMLVDRQGRLAFVGLLGEEFHTILTSIADNTFDIEAAIDVDQKRRRGLTLKRAAADAERDKDWDRVATLWEELAVLDEDRYGWIWTDIYQLFLTDSYDPAKAERAVDHFFRTSYGNSPSALLVLVSRILNQIPPERRDLDLALRVATRVCQMDSNLRGDAYFKLATVQYRRGKIREALQALETALPLSPEEDRPNLRANIDMLTERLGESDPAASLTTQYDFGPVRERILREIEGKGIPSIAVAVTKDGEIIWEEGFGLADRENGTAATEHTLYTLCSVAKPVTATGLMLLVERGLVDLDKPVNDYLGEAKLWARLGSAEEATIRRVANHTSGLPRWYSFFLEDEPYRRPPMEQTIQRYGNLVWRSGEYRYSNLGYGVLDYVIERVSGHDFADFMRDEVFVPLGMTHSSVLIPPNLDKHKSIRYMGDGSPRPFFDTDNRGGGAIYSSAHDMARFGMFLLKNERRDQEAILSDASIDEMIRPTFSISADRTIGVAWQNTVTNTGKRLVEHWGSMPGATTGFTFVPSENTAMVVLSNGHRVSVTRIRDLILEALGLANSPAPGEDAEIPSPGQGFRPGPGLVGVWKGLIATYQGDMPLTLEIREGGDVRAQLSSELPTLLREVNFGSDDVLTGEMTGTIDTEDVRNRGHSHAVALRLKLRGEVLNGEASSFSLNDYRSNLLTHWVELKKQTHR